METQHQPIGTSATGSRTDGAADIHTEPISPTGSELAGKADLGKRFVAAIIDGVIAGVIGFVPFVGGLAGAAYILARDGLDLDFMRQGSIGKQVMKLRPVRLDGRPMDIETSLRRNWMFGLGALVSVLLYIPIIGWALIPVVGLIGLALCIFEVYKVLTSPDGRRWGDELAGTKVIEVPERVVVPR